MAKRVAAESTELPAVEPWDEEPASSAPAVAEQSGFEAMTGGALASLGGDFIEEDLYLGDADGSRYPRLRLAQGLSAEVQDGTARPGQWVLEDYEAEEAVTLLVTNRYVNRMLLAPSGEGSRDDIVCRTERLVVKKPIPSLPLVGSGEPGGLCSECPHSQWTPRNDGSGKNNPPKCLLIHTLEVVSLTHAARVEVQFKKTSERTLLDMVKAMQKAGGAGKVLFELSSEKKSNLRGQPYYVPVVKTVPVTEKHLARWQEIQAELQ